MQLNSNNRGKYKTKQRELILDYLVDNKNRHVTVDEIIDYTKQFQIVNEYGETKANKCIEELSLYKKSKGIEYKSDFATIKRWVIARVEEIEERQEKRSNNKKKSNRFNYEQRQYSAEFFESLYDNIPPMTSSNSEEDEMDL